MTERKKRVLVLGAGSAGAGAAMALKKSAAGKPGIEVTLVDQRSYHFVMPLVYQVLTGSVAPSHISFPLRIMLRSRGKPSAVRFMQSRVQEIDLEKQRVVLDNGALEWDYLVVALGSTSNFFGMDDLRKNVMGFKSLKDAIDIHNRILDNYEAALLETDEQRRRELLTFVVVGGGPSGVELTASVQDFVGNVLVKDYPLLTPYVRVILIEAQDALLSGMKPRMGELAVARLRSRGIEVLLRTRINEAWPGGLRTADDQVIPTNCVIWAAGIKPVAVVEALPLDKARDGRIIVNEYMEVPASPGVYVIGDCAYLLQPNGALPYPPTHQVSIRQGPACARNILKTIKEQPRSPFRYWFKGQIVYIDRNVAVAQLFGRVFDGYAAGFTRRMLYLQQMLTYLGPLTGFKSKLSSTIDWFFAYFYYRNTAHLE